MASTSTAMVTGWAVAGAVLLLLGILGVTYCATKRSKEDVVTRYNDNKTFIPTKRLQYT